ncbi:serine/threonine-protein kinase [Leifsonia sp. F6_8S_P_1B]|uniref:non-specific serine/threonine protein kinase n=1 Tax=Leifsonia williamsii TaxID=3035919 RepID=A0ABT8KA60_9MICO|nr:serine/threonine-protein kinase [Leifsonia williamsii]MDN4614335.1 serine/threonine-protein kinase [Leifsonia williamsii]
MTPPRSTTPPPALDGYEYRGVLGSGGFAEVFLYEQRLPQRMVAVKVLNDGTLAPGVREQFEMEANVMARLSQHPSIVTIHQAGVAGDGRPYIVMEYCPREGYGARFRQVRIPLDEVLRVGVRLAGALETAHRAGILHRDIKPANILVTNFGWPALTDFGIATVAGSEPSSGGLSVPWAPPELFTDDAPFDVRSDVFSLGATLYSLLAGRSPFEVVGGSNSSAELMARIESAPLAPTGRRDIPDRLEALLHATMAKSPHERPNSAMAVGRALQRIETACGFQQTAMEVSDLSSVQPSPAAPVTPAASGGALHEGRIRPVVQIRPEDGEQHPPTAVTPTVSPVDEATRAAVRPGSNASAARPSASPVDEVTRVAVRPSSGSGTAASSGPAAPAGRAKKAGRKRGRSRDRAAATRDAAASAAPGSADGGFAARGSAAREATDPDSSIGKRRPLRLVIMSAAAAVLLVAGGLVAYNAIASSLGGPAAASDGSDGSGDTPSTEATDASLSADAVPSPKGLTGKKMADGSAVFSWSNPDPEDGDQYLWGISGTGVAAGFQLVGQPSLTIPADQATEGQICVDVSIVRKDRRASVEPARACAE